MKIRSILATSLCALVGAACSPRVQQQSAGGDYPLMTVKPEDRQLSVKYSAVIKGKQDVEICPQVSGIITQVCVEEGAPVRKGQVLFVIDQVPYRAALKKAQASVATAQANEATAKQNLEGKEELYRERVISDFELRTASNEYKSAQAALLQAEAERRKGRRSHDGDRSVDGRRAVNHEEVLGKIVNTCMRAIIKSAAFRFCTDSSPSIEGFSEETASAKIGEACARRIRAAGGLFSFVFPPRCHGFVIRRA